MTESEAVEKLKNMRLFMQITDENNDCKFTEDDYKANEMAIKALEKQIPKKPVEMKPTDKLLNGYFACPMCGGWVGMDEYSNEYCGCCGQKINWSDEE